MGPFWLWPEIDISVLKLLGFETFANFLRVSVNLVSEKITVYVFENLVSENKSPFQFQKIWCRKKSAGFGFGEFSLGNKFQFRNIWYRKKVSVLVLEKKKSISPKLYFPPDNLAI